jgi:glycosyltransferase involved in cell wall biosynthesis
MIKVLLVSTNADEAGAPRHIENIVKLLGRQVEFLCIFGSKGPVSERLYKKLKKKVFILKGMRSSINPVKDIFLFIKFYFLVKKINPDLIHCHSSKASIFGRLLTFFTNRKVLITIHGWPWRGFDGWKFKIIVFIEKILVLFSKCHYIGVAKCLLKEAKDVGIEISDRNFSLIYNSSEISKEEITIPEDNLLNSKFMIMPARVCAAKDHAKLARAFDNSIFKGNLVFAGEGTDEKEFIDLIYSLMKKKHAKVFFLGERNDMAKLIFHSEFVALCSNFETFPLIIPESASMSKPLILSKVGGNQEILRDKFDSVFAETQDEWTEAINYLSSEEKLKKISSNLKNTYIEKLSSSRTRKYLLNLYKKL